MGRGICGECEDQPAVLGCAECCEPEDNNQAGGEKRLCEGCSLLLHSLKKRRFHHVRPLVDAEDEAPVEAAWHLTAYDIPDFEELELTLPKLCDGTLGIDVGQIHGVFVVQKICRPADKEPSELRVGDAVVRVQGRSVHNVVFAQLLHLLHREPLAVKLHVVRGQDVPQALLHAWLKLERAREQAAQERSKEIISLQQTPSGHYQLRPNDANLDVMFEDAADSDAKVPVISFLGNTTAGKSFLIRSLMGDSEIRPFCFDEDKMCSTTANANMYSSTYVVPHERANVIDFEGENGLTPFMNMVLRTKNLFHSSKAETKQRHVAVQKYFPKIAYLLSDVIVLVGDTSLVNKDYFTRCRDFAVKANVGISETMCRPSMLIVHNKCSLTANFNVEATTAEFMQAHIYDEYDVVFADKGPVGLDLLVPEADDNQARGFVAVEAVTADGLASKSNKIHVRDLIVAVGGTSTEQFGVDKVYELLETSPRPLTVTFRSADILNSEAKGFLEYFADVKCVRVPRGDIRQNIRGKWYNGDEILQQQLVAIHHLLADMTAKQKAMRTDISVGERGWFFLLRSIVTQVANEQPVSFATLLNDLLSTGDRDVSAQAKKSLALLLKSVQRFLPCVSACPMADGYVCGQHRMFHSGAASHRTTVKVPRSGGRWNRWLSELDGGRHIVWEGGFEGPSLPVLFFEAPYWEDSFVQGVLDHLFTSDGQSASVDQTDELLLKLLTEYRGSLMLDFKVFSENALGHIPCTRCFKGCDAKAVVASTMKERLLQLHSRIELLYLAPHHLGVCIQCKPFFVDLGLLPT
ncbi:hypothetical protein ACHHYP_01863 [Achlya hypogyna]|uniref:PDZ domain-containing protein n=1 Tax=Achlya hypogyna TaxID=1202772 RepID=A0A1V9Z7W1_ACHHY|nr:hypothetical protein ACHHYP_01863 [Achlya hypogyna]